MFYCICAKTQATQPVAGYFVASRCRFSHIWKQLTSRFTERGTAPFFVMIFSAHSLLTANQMVVYF